MNKLRLIGLWLIALIAMTATAQQMPQLPVDTAVRIGKLPNGLTYYIRHNALPANRANFYIAQKVGSVQEEESQRGLAHFLEHMCFNGTDHFPGDNIVKYCERIGVKFGQNLNAYTSTDETVYNIDDVPVSEPNIDSCLLILRDWADGLILDPAEIDKERGVIHEEWRMRSSASGRIFERNLPTLYPGSRYGNRYPIGLMSVVDNFKPEELRAYYEKWYRPDLQGIIVVGDINVDAVEAKIKALFSPIVMPQNPAAYEHYPVPDNNAPIYVIDKDKEQAQSVIQIMFKHDQLPEEYKNTVAYLTNNYIVSLASHAFNARINELSQKSDCPFIAAYAYDGDYIMSKTKGAFSLGIIPKPGRDAEALQAVMQEVRRVDLFGFTETEISRANDEFISGLETIYDNRDKQENSFYVPQYVRHFLEGDPIPDLSTEFETYKMLAQQLTQMKMAHQLAGGLFKEYTARTDTNFVCLAMYPEKEGVTIPTADQFKQAIATAMAAQLEAYVDNVKSEPLVPQLPAKGKIAKEEAADFGYTCWTLENGARVFFKQTDFNDSEVQFEATSFGGESLIPLADYVNGSLTAQAINSCGLGNFKSTELQKKLAGKQASCSVSIGSLSEGLSGMSTPKDLRTLFELIYLRFQAPADDPDAYQNFMSFQRTSRENADKQPMVAFSDSLMATIYGHNPRKATIKLADLEKADYATMKRIYGERFRSAGDFDFFFTGAFNLDSLRLFTEQYIAPLKGVTARERFVDHKDYPVAGTVDNHFFRPMETPQAIIVQLWTGEHPYSLKEAAVANALGSVLTKRYLKSIREDAGIAYSVGAQGSLQPGVPESYLLAVQCPVQPAKLDSALLLMRQGLLDVAEKGVTADELSDVREFELKDYADSQKKNGYWMSLIKTKTVWNKDLRTGYEDAVNAVTSDAVRDFAKMLLDRKNCITVSMRPTDMTEKENTK